VTTIKTGWREIGQTKGNGNRKHTKPAEQKRDLKEAREKKKPLGGEERRGQNRMRQAKPHNKKNKTHRATKWGRWPQ